jgi:DNA invertase Pin-like site-specific DNA recombinase
MSSIVGYVRVSTARQASHGTSLTSQAESITGQFPAAEIRAEVASAKNLRGRPILTRTLASMSRGDTLVVAKLDRLVRNTRELLQIADEARDGGWAVVLLDMGLDTSTPVGRMTLTVLGAIAEFERARNIERVCDAVELARPEIAERREMVLGLRAQGHTVARIVRETGFHREAVNRVIRRTA